MASGYRERRSSLRSRYPLHGVARMAAVQAWVLTRLPELEAPDNWLAKACRKLLSELELLVLLELVLPPNALTRLLKLLCRLASAELVPLLVVVPVELDEPERF